MSRVLITGATGFIGSSVCKHAVERGHDVAVLTRRPAGFTNDVNQILGSMASPPWSNIELFKPEIVIHSAWIATPGVYLSSLENKLHLEWSKVFFANCVKIGVKRFLGLGTCVEYGIDCKPATEDSTPIDPLTEYARTKNELRVFLEAQRIINPEVQTVWGRVFYPYGLGEHPERFCSSVIRSIQQGRVFNVANPESVKDYINITDLAGAIIKVAEAPVCGSINLGVGKGITVLSLAQTIAELLGRPDLINVSNHVQSDPFSYVVANCKKLHSIGWKQNVNIKDGLKAMINSHHI